MKRIVEGSNKAGTRFLPGVPVEHRRGVSRQELVTHFEQVIKKLGYVPTASEYKKLSGNKFGSGAYTNLGHVKLAGLCGYVRVKVSNPHRANGFGWAYIKKGSRYNSFVKKTERFPHECLNGTYCVARPINRVKQRFEYCKPCKVERGWYD